MVSGIVEKRPVLAEGSEYHSRIRAIIEYRNAACGVLGQFVHGFEVVD